QRNIMIREIFDHIFKGVYVMDSTYQTKKTKLNYTVIVLWLFLGWFGAHRFYMKRYISAILMLLTGVVSFILIYDIIVYAIAYIIIAFVEGGIWTPLFTVPMFLIALLFKGFIFIFIWWVIDLFFVIKFSRIHNS